MLPTIALITLTIWRDDDHSEVDGEVKVVVNSMTDQTLIGVSPVTTTSSDDSQLDISLDLGDFLMNIIFINNMG